MATVFTMIIDGDLPGRFVWNDDRCVAFLSINPLAPGHTLVVPREEVDHWLDLDDDLRRHLFDVAHAVGRAIHQAWRPAKVGLMIAGLEVAHTHLHVSAVNDPHDLDFARAQADPDPADLDDAAARIRAALRELGYEHVAG